MKASDIYSGPLSSAGKLRLARCLFAASHPVARMSEAISGFHNPRMSLALGLRTRPHAYSKLPHNRLAEAINRALARERDQDHLTHLTRLETHGRARRD